jgi:integrase/recombinase XerD
MLMNKLSPAAFKSVYAKHIVNFIDYKKSLGYKYETESYALLRFDGMCVEAGKSEPILDELVISKWINQSQYESFHTKAQRKSIIKMFGLYLNSHGIKAYIPMTRFTSYRTNSFKPYIFTHEQAKLLLKLSYRVVTQRGGTSTMYLDFPLIVNLLYCTGMRISEVLNMYIKDFDLNTGVIHIQNSKFEKSRLVPVSNSLKTLCVNYFREVHTISGANDWFFSNLYHHKYHKGTIYANFRKLLRMCNISHGGKGTGPRLHDLRHTFAVHSLQSLISQGKDIYVSLPILSEYLGHSNIYSTEKYLRLTAEIYPEISEKSNSIIPEVTPNETY